MGRGKKAAEVEGNEGRREQGEGRRNKGYLLAV